MVKLMLSGGLGNQMFQYAAAKALAIRLGTSLDIDTYSLTKKTQATRRKLELDVFNIEINKAKSIKGKILIKIRPYIFKHQRLLMRLGFFTDTYAILYNPTFQTIKGNTILSGYFQNEKYFKEAIPDIRKDFIFRQPLTGKNSDIARQMESTNSVSIHIRRGDYITNKSASANFAICDAGYYGRAIDTISQRIGQPSFFIFSDDMEWVKSNIKFGENPVTFIGWNKGDDSYMDMQLMSLCKHNIIANSSFSWWGAWLNTNKDKTVVAPAKWFRDEWKNNLLDDFYPNGWIKL